MTPKYPDVNVELVGQDGNVFNIIGLVSKALKKAGYRDAANDFTSNAFACGSYEDVLQLTISTVTVS